MLKYHTSLQPHTQINMMRSWHSHQTGVSLIELMVGITIGLLTIIVALSALMVSRGISGTVSEANHMQQQGAYAFRVIGQQLRQAGSVELNLAYNKNDTQKTAEAPTAWDRVAFEANIDRSTKTIKGKDNPNNKEYMLEVGYQNYKEANFTTTNPASFFRDCLGEGGELIFIESKFARRNNNTLTCKGNNIIEQPIIENVTDLKISYLMQDKTIASIPTIKTVNATDVEDKWMEVFGVQVCLELSGTETIDTAGTEYTDCNGNLKSRDNKLRMIFLNTFQIRSQGGPI